MSRSRYLLISVLASMIIAPDACFGQGRGGGSRSGGRSVSSGGSTRPSSGSISRGGGARPSTPNPGGSRPSVSRPNVGQSPSRPNIQSPSRPNNAGQMSRPPVNRPSGGLAPSTRPSIPSVNTPRPNLPSAGNRPGTGGSGVGSRPNVRPDTSIPNLANRPANRPGTAAPLPGVGNRPNLANRPGVGTGPGGNARPTPGDVGDFLGIARPLQPGGGGATALPGRPGLGDRPSNLPGGGIATTLPGRPGLGNLPGNLPGGGGATTLPGRPGLANRPGNIPGGGNRPGINDRPNLTDRSQWTRNSVINSRPGWANINSGVNVNIHNRWNNAFVNPGRAGWWNRPSNRVSFWAGWGLGVRSGWGQLHRNNGWFAGPWWGSHRFPMGGWHFHLRNHNFPARHWWGVPTWPRLSTWFIWTAPRAVWAQPVYYDYGADGNVTYQNGMVNVGGEEVATEAEFAMSAMDLATVAPPQSDEEASEAEWLPLGTFAISTNEKDSEPNQVVQLAVNKAGIISGTLYNIETDQAQAVQGQVDKETQRVAFRLGESEVVVAETGLYNLTQEQSPLHVHFGTERTENYLLVRLEYTDDEVNSPPQR